MARPTTVGGELKWETPGRPSAPPPFRTLASAPSHAQPAAVRGRKGHVTARAARSHPVPGRPVKPLMSKEKRSAAACPFAAHVEPRRRVGPESPAAVSSAAVPLPTPDRPARSPSREAPAPSVELAERPDPVDPLTRALAVPPTRLSPPEPALGQVPTSALSTHSIPDEWIERVVRRFAWGGNGRRGTARLELGVGPLAGATLTLHAEGDEVVVRVEGAKGDQAAAWAAQLTSRLGGRGIVVRDVEIG